MKLFNTCQHIYYTGTALGIVNHLNVFQEDFDSFIYKKLIQFGSAYVFTDFDSQEVKAAYLIEVMCAAGVLERAEESVVN